MLCAQGPYIIYCIYGVFEAVGALSVQWNMGCAEELALSLSNGTLLLLTVARDVNISCKKEKMNASVGESDRSVYEQCCIIVCVCPGERVDVCGCGGDRCGRRGVCVCWCW